VPPAPAAASRIEPMPDAEVGDFDAAEAAERLVEEATLPKVQLTKDLLYRLMKAEFDAPT